MTDKQDISLVKFWELALFLPTLGLSLWLFWERADVFEDAVRDYSSGSSFLLLCWVVPVFVILLCTRPWRSRSRYGSVLGMSGLVLCSLSTALIFTASFAHHRVKLLRFELRHLPLQIALKPDRPARSISRYVLSYDSGPRVLKDKELLKTMAANHGRGLLQEDDRATALIWLALIKQGIDFEQSWEQDEYKWFLLACWQADDEPLEESRFRFRWAEPLLADQGHLLSAAQKKQIAHYFWERRDELTTDQMQSLLWSACRDETVLDASRMEALLQSWAGRLAVSKEPLAETLEHRELLKAFFSDDPAFTLASRVGKWERSTYNVLYDKVPSSLDSMLESLFGSLGMSLEFVETWEEADVRCQISLEAPSNRSTFYRRPPEGSIHITFTKRSGEVLELDEVPYFWSPEGYRGDPSRVWPLGFDQRLLDRELKYFL